jgi:hypothetical protein
MDGWTSEKYTYTSMYINMDDIVCMDETIFLKIPYPVHDWLPMTVDMYKKE